VNFFETESAFDGHKTEQLRNRAGEAVAGALEKLIKPLRAEYSEKFVLTHGDLHQENIHVRSVTHAKGKSRWELSRIMD
jgi:Ser/Thr protein kinase RdoA (MazF antagonist)